MKVSGIIDTITSKTVSNGGTVYEAIIDGNVVNLGFQCNHKEGEYVDLTVENTKWGLQVPRQPRGAKPSAGSGSTPRQAPINPVPSAKSVFPVDPNTKDHSIIRQNALTNANTAVSTAIRAGAFNPTSKDEVYNEIILVAYNLSTFAMGTMDGKFAEEIKKQQAAQAAMVTEKDYAAAVEEAHTPNA